MVGLGSENSNFVFELTYNYGIDSYATGNDVQYFALAMPEAVPRAQALGYPVVYEQGLPVILGPDSFRYKIVEPVAGREERLIAVGLRTSDLAASKAYWCGILGMSEFPTASGLEAGHRGSLSVGWAADQTHLQFIDLGDGKPVDHALAVGIIAMRGTRDELSRPRLSPPPARVPIFGHSRPPRHVTRLPVPQPLTSLPRSP